MSSRSRSEVIVYLDAPESGPRRAVGVLHASGGSRGVISFTYARSWLQSTERFPIDPRLPLVEFEQYVREGLLPGIFADTAPDRWGRTLLERREAMEARTEKRRPRTLTDWDYLLGVGDIVRMGALRLALRPGDAEFLDGRDRAVPPLNRLRDLEFAASELERTRSLSETDESGWLTLLLAPGSSLGGSRPKASYLDEAGGLWIAKFPSGSDIREVGAWEYLLTDLAAEAGIEVSQHQLLVLAAEHRTYAARRFDRLGGDRRLFASAMTLAGKRDGEEASYLDIAMAIADHGVAATIAEDLEQLFRRVVFNVIVANRDDHLRNHGFLRTNLGWRLAPAFDLNPSPEKLEHGLALDERNRQPELDLVRDTADWYRLRRDGAEQIVAEVSAAVASWRARARALRLASNEVDLVASALASA